MSEVAPYVRDMTLHPKPIDRERSGHHAPVPYLNETTP